LTKDVSKSGHKGGGKETSAVRLERSSSFGEVLNSFELNINFDKIRTAVEERIKRSLLFNEPFHRAQFSRLRDSFVSSTPLNNSSSAVGEID
jgi:hypothetical protein